MSNAVTARRIWSCKVCNACASPVSNGRSRFRSPNIETVESGDATTVETEALGAKVFELYGSLKHDRRQLPAKLDRYLSELRDLEMLSDLMASTFVNDPLRRQRLLEERSLNQRLRFLIGFLRDEIGNAAA